MRLIAVAVPHISRRIDTFGFLWAPRFSLLSYVDAIEPVRMADRLAERELYRRRSISTDGRPVAASNGTAVVVDYSLRDRADYRCVLVCAGFEPETLCDRRVGRWLAAKDRTGAALGRSTRAVACWRTPPARRLPGLGAPGEPGESAKPISSCAGRRGSLRIRLSGPYLRGRYGGARHDAASDQHAARPSACGRHRRTVPARAATRCLRPPRMDPGAARL